MSLLDLQICLFAQTGRSVGLGHLKRISAISTSLKREFTTVTIIPYEANMVSLPPLPCCCDVTIIDGITVPDNLQAYISKSRICLSTSPYVVDLQCIQKVFFRSNIPCDIKYSRKLSIDFRYGFVTCIPRKNFQIKFPDKPHVGICLSGEDHRIDSANLAITLSRHLPSYSFSCILADKPPPYYPENLTFLERQLSLDLFWQSIDIFITGSGLMTYEACAQCLPTLSLCNSHSETEKNTYLIKQQLMRSLTHTDDDICEIISFIENYSLHYELARNCSAILDQGWNQVLSCDIITFIHECSCD